MQYFDHFEFLFHAFASLKNHLVKVLSFNFYLLQSIRLMRVYHNDILELSLTIKALFRNTKVPSDDVTYLLLFLLKNHSSRDYSQLQGFIVNKQAFSKQNIHVNLHNYFESKEHFFRWDNLDQEFSKFIHNLRFCPR